MAAINKNLGAFTEQRGDYQTAYNICQEYLSTNPGDTTMQRELLALKARLEEIDVPEQTETSFDESESVSDENVSDTIVDDIPADDEFIEYFD